MAVEAQRLHSLFPLQFSSNREIMNPVEANAGFYDSQVRYGAIPSLDPPSTATAADAALFNHPMCNIAAAADSFVPHIMKPVIQSVDSSITFNGDNINNNNNNDLLVLPLVSSPLRKRSREDSFVINPSTFPQSSYVQNEKSWSNPMLFLGHDMSLHVQQQQLDVDRLISHYMERVKMEMEEKRKRQGRRIMEAIEQGIVKRLRAKDEEIEKIGKMNIALEEKVRSLCLENQIWRDLARSSEATANALRTNLQQVLAAAERSQQRSEEAAAAGLADDAQSCCGSTDGAAEEEGEEGRRRLEGEAQDRKRVRKGRGTCKKCGTGEACVLLLPCRHLCLCTVCGSSSHTCPICKSVKNASVNVNLSS